MSLPQRAAAEIVILKQFEVVPTMEIDESAGTVGLRLAAARKAKGLSLDEVHAATKVKLPHLTAIEAGDRAALPATPFAAGFVKAYAQFLGLDPDQSAKAYRAEIAAASAPPAAPSTTPDTHAETSAPMVGVLATSSIAAVEIEPSLASVAPLVFDAPASAPASSVVEATASAPPPAASEEPAPSAAFDSPASLKTPPASEETLILDGAAIGTAAPAAPAVEKPATRAGAALVAADRFVLYFGMGAAALVGVFVGANFFGEGRTPAPVVAEAPAPAPIKIARPAPAPPAPVVEADAPPTVPVSAPSLKPKPRRKVAAVVAAPRAEATAPEPLPEPAAVEAAPEIVPARMIRAAEPTYPDRCANRARRSEDVEVVFDVTAEGRADNGAVAEASNDCFNDAALDALRRMRFSPRTIGGEPAVEVGKHATIRFTR